MARFHWDNCPGQIDPLGGPPPGLDQIERTNRAPLHQAGSGGDLNPGIKAGPPPPIGGKSNCKVLVIAGEKIVSTQFVLKPQRAGV